MILDRVYSIHELSTCSGGATQESSTCMVEGFFGFRVQGSDSESRV